MAKIEAELGIQAAYFVLLSSRLYNLLDKTSLVLAKQILNLGHEIGLHYDLVVYRAYGRDLTETLKDEANFLERLLRFKVVSISRHNDSLSPPEDPFSNVKGYLNAYNPSFLVNYVSDSCRAWFRKDLERLASMDWDTAQSLIHPFLWNKNFCSREQVLDRLFRMISFQHALWKVEWKKLWRSSQKVKDYDS